jgi:hypothetical protein
MYANLCGVVGGDIADNGVMAALARRYGIKIVIFIPPKTDAMDSAQGRRRNNLRGWHIAPEDIGGRSKNLCTLATHVHCVHVEPGAPFSGCSYQLSRFEKVTEQDCEGYCPALGQ